MWSISKATGISSTGVLISRRYRGCWAGASRTTISHRASSKGRRGTRRTCSPLLGHDPQHWWMPILSSISCFSSWSSSSSSSSSSSPISPPSPNNNSADKKDSDRPGDESTKPQSPPAAGANTSTNKTNNGSSTIRIVDAHPLGVKKKIKKKICPRLPMVTSLEEFPPDRSQALRRQQATMRILKIAASRLIEPPTLHLLAFTAWATMGIASLEGILLCKEWIWIESIEAGKFVWWYSIAQLVPSIIWETQSAVLVAHSLEMDPSSVLRDLTGDDPASATALLRIHLLTSTRYVVAGFVMIASIVRAAGVSAGALSKYEEAVRMGREPPLELLEKPSPGVVIRMCGKDSYTTEVSLQKMGAHLLPVFERPDRVQYLLARHSENLHRPVYWCVREGKYGSAYSWDRFPADHSIFIPMNPTLISGGKRQREDENHNNDTPGAPARSKLLILEADATNPNDPLALGNTALDLNLDDASQGFRRIQQRFSLAHPPTPNQPKPFKTIRVYLGNSLEMFRTGGGHSYTLRHRVRYAKEIDVLIDSRAPVLERILDWCRRVAGQDRRIFFQTSSPEYFRSLQKILKFYGYEIYDPLDLRTLWLSQTDKPNKKIKFKQQQQQQQQHEPPKNDTKPSDSSLPHQLPEEDGVPPSLLGILMEDPLLYNMWRERGIQEIIDSFSSPGFRLTSRDAQKDTKKQTDEDEDQQEQQEQERQQKNSEMLRQVVKMAKLPRLVHMPTTAETVNAVEALITAGEVDATYCCAILERQDGVQSLEYILTQKSDLIRGERHQEWIQDSEYDGHGNDEHHNKNHNQSSSSPPPKTTTTTTNPWAYSRRNRAGGGAGLQMICTSTIYDDLFRQVRMWARMGFTSAQIQKEIDLRFHEILDYSHEAQQQEFFLSAVDAPLVEQDQETTRDDATVGRSTTEADKNVSFDDDEARATSKTAAATTASNDSISP